jgi:hypothetical protein
MVMPGPAVPTPVVRPRLVIVVRAVGAALDAGLEVGRLRRLLPGLALRGPEEAVAHWAATAPPAPWAASGSAGGPR